MTQAGRGCEIFHPYGAYQTLSPPRFKKETKNIILYLNNQSKGGLKDA